MAKQGMKRFYPDRKQEGPAPVPALQGKEKSGKRNANPMIPGTNGKVYHTAPHPSQTDLVDAFAGTGNDLGAENLANDMDMTAAELLDLERG